MLIIKYLAVSVIIATICFFIFLYTAPEKFKALMINTARRLSGLERREITLPGGIKYVYLEGGKGEPLMLLHGFGGDKDNFTLVARYLRHHYKLIIPDHVGFGESAHPGEADYSFTAQAERLRSLARANGIDRLHLGGNSMGGQIALAYAARYPKEVKSLWLLDPGGVISAPEGLLLKSFRGNGENALLAKNEADFIKMFRLTMYNPPCIPRPILRAMARVRMNNFALEEYIFNQLKGISIEKEIAGSTVPALIVWGAEDRIIHPASSEILHRLMKNSVVVIMPGIGHIPMIEAPARCAKDYLKFRSGQ